MSRFITLIGVFLLTGCAASSHYNPQAEENLTVGTVQKEVRIGMSGAQVAQVLGSPNIVSTDEDRNEVWVYDKISTQYVQANVGAGLLILGGGSDAGGIVGAGGRQSSGARSQRTLTVVIKFDEQNLVRDFSYHTSRF